MSDKRTYKEKLLDPRWQKMRLQILERDGWTCRCCGSKDKTLHAHHTFYILNVEPWDYAPHTVITLCDDCHSQEHEGWAYEQELLMGRIVMAGFGMNHEKRELADVIRMLAGLPTDERQAMLKALCAAAASRLLKNDGKATGDTWAKFLALGEKKVS